MEEFKLLLTFPEIWSLRYKDQILIGKYSKSAIFYILYLSGPFFDLGNRIENMLYFTPKKRI